MTPNERFGIISRYGSPIFEGTDQQKLDELLTFLANIDDWSLGTVPANAPLKKSEDEDGN